MQLAPSKFHDQYDRTESILKYWITVTSGQASTFLNNSLSWVDSRHCRTLANFTVTLPRFKMLFFFSPFWCECAHWTALFHQIKAPPNPSSKMCVKGVVSFLFFSQHTYPDLHQSSSLPLSQSDYPAVRITVISSPAVLLMAVTALSSTHCQHLRHGLVDSEHTLPYHHSCPEFSQGVFKFRAGACFWRQPQNCPTYHAALCITEQAPGVRTGFLLYKTELEEVTQKHRWRMPTARSVQSRGPH